MLRAKKWLVIFVARQASEALKDLELWEGLDADLQSKRHVRLYNCRSEDAIALPLESGAAALLLQPAEAGGNYLACRRVYEHPVKPKAGMGFYHELPDNVAILLESREHLAEKAAPPPHRIDYVKLQSEVLSKSPWDPTEGADQEARKWKALLKLQRELLNSQTIENLPVKGFRLLKGKQAAVEPSFPAGADIPEMGRKLDRILGGSGGFQCRLPISEEAIPLGKLMQSDLSHHHPYLTFALERDFYDSFARYISKEIAPGAGSLTAVRAGHRTPVPVTKLEVGKAKTGHEAQWSFYTAGEEAALLFSGAASEEQGAFRLSATDLLPGQLSLSTDDWQLGQLETMEKQGIAPITKLGLWKALSGERRSAPPKEIDCTFSSRVQLNEEQKRAVKLGLGNRELTLIWGPPGTGKTSVIAEIAVQQAVRGHTTLISSQANLAVDNALERLWGHEDAYPLRLLPAGGYQLEEEGKKKIPTPQSAGDFFLTRLIERLRGELESHAGGREGEMRRDFLNALNSVGRERTKGADGQHEAFIDQMRSLYMRRVNVIGATLMGAARGKRRFPDGVPTAFDTVIVDEASKALPPEICLPISKGRKEKESVILVGDHKQLPPVLKDFHGFEGTDPSGRKISYKQLSKEADVKITEDDEILFKRLWDRNDDSCRVMLTKQYRMHKHIQELVSPFYEDEDTGGLICGLSEEAMQEMIVFANGLFANRHVAWVDTKRESREQRSGAHSLFNPGEVTVVGRLLELLTLLPASKKRGLSVGVIAFYQGQMQALQEKHGQRLSQKLPGGLQFGTVDSFQGREFDVVICSLVRSNKHGSVGFASFPNRVNVAFSRARRLLLIVGNSGQFLSPQSTSDAYWRPFENAYQVCREKGVVCSRNDIDKELRQRKALQQRRRRGDAR